MIKGEIIINYRSLIILEKLEFNTTGVQTKCLAKELGVSTRSISSDVKELNVYLKNIDCGKIVNDNGKLKLQQRETFSKVLSRLTFSDFNLTKEDRLLMEFLLLALSNDYIKISNISEILYVSRSTVLNDLKHEKNFFYNNNITVYSKPGRGISLQGDEWNIRLFISEILNEKLWITIILMNSLNAFLERRCNLIKVHYLDDIKSVVASLEHEFNIVLEDAYYYRLLLYLLISVTRIKNNYRVLSSPIDVEGYIYNIRSFNILNQQLNELFRVKWNDLEQILLETIVDKVDLKESSLKQVDKISIQFLTKKLINSISRDLNVPIYMDYELLKNLSLHLERMNSYNVGDLNVDIDLKKLVDDNIDIYYSVKKNSRLLEYYFNRKITEIEISYIIVYVYVSLSKLLGKVRSKLDVTIICNSGVGTSYLLSSKLKDIFRLNVSRVLNSHQIQDIRFNTKDIVISTVNLGDIGVEYAIVSPTINEKDYNILNEYLESKSKSYIKDIDYVNIYKFDEVIVDNEYEYIISNSIKDYLNENNILVNALASDWKDAITISSAPLIEKGIIKEGYVLSMIENIDKYGPYIVLDNKLALPHAEASDLVKETGFSLCCFKEDVNFDEEGYLPVKYVCVLAATGSDEHIKALFELTNLFSNIEFVQDLEKANSSLEVKLLITQYIDMSYLRED